MKKKARNYYTTLAIEHRRLWSLKSDTRKKVLKSAMLKDKNGLERYTCNTCKNDHFSKSDIHVDHIYKCGKYPENIHEYHDYIDRVESEFLQVLCKKCHLLKSKNDVNEIKYDNNINEVNKYLEFFGYMNINKNNVDTSLCKKMLVLLKNMKEGGRKYTPNKIQLEKILNEM